MKIEELIIELSNYPEDYEVYVSDKGMLEIGLETEDKYVVERIINVNNKE